jgi:sarcosine oxidase
MQKVHARNVILGAGAMGSAAAYHLAKQGEPVLLIEQFRLGHDRGSSHGAARITRHSYADVRYARLMPAAFRAWRELEADAGRTLYYRTGGVSVCPPEVDYVARVASSLEDLGVPHKRMRGAELRRAFSAFGVPDDHEVVFEPDAGMLTADRALAVQVELARTLGGSRTEIRENTAVRRVDLDADRPTVVTDDLEIVAERLIVSAGTWVGKLLPTLASTSRPTLQQVLYFRPRDSSPYAMGQLPVFIFKGSVGGHDFYGMPEFLGCGVKVARHGGPGVDPDNVDRSVSDEYRALIREFLRVNLPGLVGAPSDRTEICLYTQAPNEDFRVGAFRGRTDVIVASPCSGHGFKFSCLIGRILAVLARHGTTDQPIDFWRVPEGDASDTTFAETSSF